LTKLTKSAIEDFAIKLFKRLGYDCIHVPDIAPRSKFQAMSGDSCACCKQIRHLRSRKMS